jgi:hypothetical protein
MSIETSHDIVGNRTRNLPVCSKVPQPTELPRASSLTDNEFLPGICLIGY